MKRFSTMKLMEKIKSKLILILPNTALVVLSLIFVFIALEIGLRIADKQPLLPKENYILKKVALLRIHLMNDYDPLVGWVLKPYFFTGPPGGATDEIAAGEFGIRMNQHKIQPVPRNGILASGDSFTAGSEVRDSETWPAYLERIMGQPVLNAGTGAWGSDQIILRARQLIPLVNPHMVIISIMIEDFQRSRFRTWAGGNKPYFVVEKGKLIHKNYPVPVFTGRVNELGVFRSIFGYSYLMSWLAERFHWTGWWKDGGVYKKVKKIDMVESNCMLLDEFKKECDEKNIRLILLMQYGGCHITIWEQEPDYGVKFLEHARKIGVEVVDSWDPLRKIKESGEDNLKKLYMMHDNGTLYGHMSPAGNEFIAKLLEKQIKSRP